MMNCIIPLVMIRTNSLHYRKRMTVILNCTVLTMLITNLVTIYIPGASPGSGRGGAIIFFSDMEYAAHGEAMRIARGFRGMLPQKIFYNDAIWCVLECFLSDFVFFFSKITIFYIKNNYFRYTLAMGYFS